MKRYFIVIFLTILIIQASSQNPCEPPQNPWATVQGTDVHLKWYSPETALYKVIIENKRILTIPFIDSSPNNKIIESINFSRDYLDVQFTFPCYYDDGEAGVESDGNFIYSSKWLDDVFAYYDLDGNFIDTFRIPGVERVRDMAYCEADGFMYGAEPDGNSSKLYRMDFSTRNLVDVILIGEPVRSLAYDSDLDIFYGNNWSSDVMLIDRQTGLIQDQVPLSGTYGSYYGFAYDNWSDGGPYLWGFSQDGSGNEIVQMALPDFTETGIVYDASVLDTGSVSLAGGLFTQPGIIEGTVTLGGLIQNKIIFGLELGTLSPPVQQLAGYNVYRDGFQVNSSPIKDTVYTDAGLSPGTYNYQITAVYEDTTGAIVCESDPAGPVTAVIQEPLVMGGNVFAGIYKLDVGEVLAYTRSGNDLSHTYTTDVNEFGYFYFLESTPAEYLLLCKPTENSAYSGDFIPTYYGDVYHWENATFIPLEEDIYNADIHLLPIVQTETGNGRISGTVNFENTDLNSTPAVDIHLILLNSQDECIASDYTDVQGYFSFDQLINGNYMLLCEVTGKKMTPLYYIITDENPYEDGIRFVISDDEIVAGIEEGLPGGVDFLSEVYPNPAGDIAYVDMDVQQVQTMSILINGMLGCTNVYTSQRLEEGLNRIYINTENLPSGIYVLNFVVGNNAYISRKLVVLH